MKSPVLFLWFFSSILVQAQSSHAGAIPLGQSFYVDGTTYTLETAYTACVAKGSGTVIVAPGYAETMTKGITLTGSCSIELPESGVITVPPGKEFTCLSSCDVVTIKGKATPVRTPGESGGIGFKFVCSSRAGTACFTIGSRGTQYFGVTLKGFAIDTTGGRSGAVGLNLIQILAYDVDLRFIGGQGQTAWKLDGTGSFVGDNRGFSFIAANGYTTCLSLNSNSNANYINGFCANTSGDGPAVDIVSGNGNILSINVESTTTAFNIANDANNFGNRLYCYCQGNKTDIAIGARANGNTFDNIGATASSQVAVSDSGSNNSVFNPYKWKVDATGSITPAGNVNVASDKVVNWNADAGLSRETANTVDCGNGSQQDKSCTFNAKQTQSARQISANGAIPTCSVTNGSNCTITAGSTDSYIEGMFIGDNAHSSGILSINFSSPLGSNRAICQLQPISNNTPWNPRATIFQINTGTSTWSGRWDNNGVNLAPSGFSFSAICFGR